jgi:hypothetical protein
MVEDMACIHATEYIPSRALLRLDNVLHLRVVSLGIRDGVVRSSISLSFLHPYDPTHHRCRQISFRFARRWDEDVSINDIRGRWCAKFHSTRGVFARRLDRNGQSPGRVPLAATLRCYL